jgi:hypothetical protein
MMYQTRNSAVQNLKNCANQRNYLTAARRSFVPRRYSRAAALAAEAPKAGMRTITSISDILGDFQVQTNSFMLYFEAAQAGHCCMQSG